MWIWATSLALALEQAEHPTHLGTDDDDVIDPVVGGDPVPPGGWPDAVAVMKGDRASCTGTLIAPDVVLTAAHCLGGITSVVVGTNDWEVGGEQVDVATTIEHPRSGDSFDVALLRLVRPVTTVAPRAIATECVLDRLLQDGADVAVVGFGRIDYAATQRTTLKHEGFTLVADADCSEDQIDGMASGCLDAVRPGGELAAGGNDVDTCNGDSGGPLYLLDPYGDATLLGVTSRAYAGAPMDEPCRYGGIYARPDAVLDWIEQHVGPVTLPVCNHPPSIVADDLVLESGQTTKVQLDLEDPDGTAVPAFRLVTGPRHGTATVTPEGILTISADATFLGEDELVVEVDDGGFPEWPRTGAPLTGERALRILVTAPPPTDETEPEAPSADPEPQAEPEAPAGCGCGTGGRTAPILASLLLLALGAIHRRR